MLNNNHSPKNKKEAKPETPTYLSLRSPPQPSDRHHIPLIMIIPTHDRLPLLHQRLPIPQLPIHGNGLIPPREGYPHLIHTRLTLDLMLIIPGHERHRRVLRQKTDDVDIILDIPHALRQRHRIFRPVGERGLRAVDHEHVFVLGGHVQWCQRAGFERVDEMPCHRQKARMVQSAILHRLGDVFVLRERP